MVWEDLFRPLIKIKTHTINRKQQTKFISRGIFIQTSDVNMFCRLTVKSCSQQRYRSFCYVHRMSSTFHLGFSIKRSCCRVIYVLPVCFLFLGSLLVVSLLAVVSASNFFLSPLLSKTAILRTSSKLLSSNVEEVTYFTRVVFSI